MIKATVWLIALGSGTLTVGEAVAFSGGPARHRSYPVVDPDGKLAGLVSRAEALGWRHGGFDPDARHVDVLWTPGSLRRTRPCPAARWPT